METGFSTQKLLNDYSSEIESSLSEFIDQEVGIRKEHHLNNIKAFVEVTRKSDLRKVISVLEGFSVPEPDTDWLKGIEETLSKAPELVLIRQNEEHFSGKKGENPKVRVGKTIKRFSRILSKSGIRIQNLFLKVFKKPEKEWEFPQREVPFTSIVQAELLTLIEELSAFESLMSRSNALVYDEVFNWCVHNSEEGDEKSEYEKELHELIDNLRIRFKNEIGQFEQHLASKLEDVKSNLAKKLASAGTIELSNRKFSADALESSKEGFSKRVEEIRACWKELILHMKSRTGVLAGTVNLKNTLHQHQEVLVDEFHGFFGELSTGSHERLHQLVQESTDELKEKQLSQKQLDQFCDEMTKDVKTLVEDELIAPISTTIEENRFTKKKEEYIEAVLQVPDAHAEKGLLLEHLDLERVLPVFDKIEVDWQKMVRHLVADHIANELASDNLQPEQQLKPFIEAYREIAQIIESNLEIVDEVTKEEDQKPVEIAIQGLERALTKIEETQINIEDQVAEFSGVISEKNEELFRELTGFLSKDDFSDIRWVETRLKVRESAGDWKTKFTVFWAGFVDRLDLMRRFVVRKYKSWFERAMIFIGRDTGTSLISEKINLATFLYETDQKFKDLPFIYRRLFDFYRDIEQNFYINNPVHFDTAKKSLALWEEGFPASLVIIGEKGSGKSTLIRFLEEDTLPQKVYSISQEMTIWEKSDLLKVLTDALSLGSVEDEKELIEKIRKQRKGSTVILENIQNVFIRAMSGYTGIKTLLTIIAETRTDIFWVVTSSRYSWNFLQVYLKVGEYFSHVISTDKLSNDEIQSMIMKRQKASGYQLRFIPDPETERSRMYKKLLDNAEEQQEYLKGKFFDKLTGIAEGNSTVAIIYWVRSIVDFNDNEITLKNLDVSGMDLLSNIESGSLFALSSFVLHDALTPEELGMSLHIPGSEAEMIISRMNTSGLLNRKSGYYSLNKLIYRQVVRVLKNKNILH
jgi:GTPase SAR1 family protein